MKKNLRKKLLNLIALLLGVPLAPQLHEGWQGGRATAVIEHHRIVGHAADGSPIYALLSRQESKNVVTTVGRDFLHTQGYGTSPSGNGLNYIGLSNDALGETSASTTLSSEITTNGLGRAAATTLTHTTGTNTTVLAKTFTASGAQSCQKAALFTAVSSGTMCHALDFTQRALISGDTITVTFTITLG